MAIQAIEKPQLLANKQSFSSNIGDVVLKSPVKKTYAGVSSTILF